jgi:hypothetical protein
LILGVNLALWLSHAAFGYAMKDVPGLFTFVLALDVVLFIVFAILGVLASWLLAFRPEAYLRTIERSIAKRNARQISN